MVKCISCDCKFKFNSATCNSNQKRNSETFKCECKNCRMCKKDYSCNPSTYTCENGTNLKSIADTSVIMYDEVINVTGSVLTNVINTISKNITVTSSINSNDKKVVYKMDCLYFAHGFIINQLLFIIAIICYHYAKRRSALKTYCLLTI